MTLSCGIFFLIVFVVRYLAPVTCISVINMAANLARADFAKYVGPTVKSNRNLIGQIKPTFFLDQKSAIVLDRISMFTDVIMSVLGFLLDFLRLWHTTQLISWDLFHETSFTVWQG